MSEPNQIVKKRRRMKEVEVAETSRAFATDIHMFLEATDGRMYLILGAVGKNEGKCTYVYFDVTATFQEI